MQAHYPGQTPRAPGLELRVLGENDGTGPARAQRNHRSAGCSGGVVGSLPLPGRRPRQLSDPEPPLPRLPRFPAPTGPLHCRAASWGTRGAACTPTRAWVPQEPHRQSWHRLLPRKHPATGGALEEKDLLSTERSLRGTTVRQKPAGESVWVGDRADSVSGPCRQMDGHTGTPRWKP